jgi:hypothetical protein
MDVIFPETKIGPGRTVVMEATLKETIAALDIHPVFPAGVLRVLSVSAGDEKFPSQARLSSDLPMEAIFRKGEKVKIEVKNEGIHERRCLLVIRGKAEKEGAR